MTTSTMTRREYLKLTVLGAGALGAGAMWSGCSKKEESLDCTDDSALEAGDKAARKAMQYVDKSPHGDKTCANCNLFQAPAEANACGGCTVLKGPIHPDGHCTAWAAQQA